MSRERARKFPHRCEACGVEFQAPKCDRRRFCGKSCAGRASVRGRDWTGPNNPRFNGGLSESEGRTIIVCRDGTWVFYYRALMEAYLGRALAASEVVHHINGDPTDDRIENLQVVTRAEHINLHRADLKVAA